MSLLYLFSLLNCNLACILTAMLSCTMHEMYQFASIYSLMLQCWELQSTTVIDWREEKEIHQHDCAVNDVFSVTFTCIIIIIKIIISIIVPLKFTFNILPHKSYHWSLSWSFKLFWGWGRGGTGDCICRRRFFCFISSASTATAHKWQAATINFSGRPWQLSSLERTPTLRTGNIFLRGSMSSHSPFCSGDAWHSGYCKRLTDVEPANKPPICIVWRW